MVPEGWTQTTLAEDVELVSGQHILADDYSELPDGTPYLTGPADFVTGHIQVTKYTNSPKSMCQAGDILITVKGSGTGSTVLSDSVYCISRQLMAVRPRRWDNHFVYYVVRQRQAGYRRDSAGLIPGLSRADILDTSILLPPLPEQKKIAAILQSVDDAIQKTQAVIEQTERVKKGLLQELLTRGMPGRHKRFKKTEIGMIPEEWAVEPLGTVAEIANQKRKPIRVSDRARMPGEYPYWGPTKILDRINEYRFEGEYTLIGEDGDHFLKWRSWEMTKWATGRFNVNNHAHVIGPTERCEARWVYYFFLHRDLTHIITRQGANRFKLKKTTLVTLPIAVPSRAEQEDIIHAVNTIRRSKDPLQREMEQLVRVKQGLMNDLLIGRVRVKV